MWPSTRSLFSNLPRCKGVTQSSPGFDSLFVASQWATVPESLSQKRQRLAMSATSWRVRLMQLEYPRTGEHTGHFTTCMMYICAIMGPQGKLNMINKYWKDWHGKTSRSLTLVLSDLLVADTAINSNHVWMYSQMPITKRSNSEAVCDGRLWVSQVKAVALESSIKFQLHIDA